MRQEHEIRYNMVGEMESRRGAYANFSTVKTVKDEVVVDFSFIDDIHIGSEGEVRDGILVSRIVMTPQAAASLADAIAKHLGKHFEQNGD